jgi:hypothetical protein
VRQPLVFKSWSSRLRAMRYLSPTPGRDDDLRDHLHCLSTLSLYEMSAFWISWGESQYIDRKRTTTT